MDVCGVLASSDIFIHFYIGNVSVPGSLIERDLFENYLTKYKFYQAS